MFRFRSVFFGFYPGIHITFEEMEVVPININGNAYGACLSLRLYNLL
jgi:hypothetical protein